MQSNPQQSLYEREHLKLKQLLGEQTSSTDSIIKQLNTQGNRYFCVFDQIKDTQQRDALELGFGWVEYANAMASVFKSYCAVDIAASTIIKERKDVQFNHVDADLNNDFPFNDAQFDVVIAMMIIEHLFDPFHSFKEVARVCKKNGLVFINLPNITSIRCRLQLLFGRQPVTGAINWFERRLWDSAHLHYFDIHHVKKVAHLYGLEMITLYPVGRFYQLKKWAPSLFCHEISFVFRKVL